MRVIENARIHKDGSFSTWAEKTNERAWITSYFVKLLSRAKKIISIEDSRIVKALKFLKSIQKSDGSFDEKTINYVYMTSNVQSPIPLTAFVISAFLESEHASEYQEVVDKGISYLEKRIVNMTDNYEMALSAFTLSLKDPSSKNTQSSLTYLERRAEKHAEKMFWYKTNARDSHIGSIHVEIASYAMMAFMNSAKANAINSNHQTVALKIMNWLISVRNPIGGFFSTVDTVIVSIFYFIHHFHN